MDLPQRYEALRHAPVIGLRPVKVDNGPSSHITTTHSSPVSPHGEISGGPAPLSPAPFRRVGQYRPPNIPYTEVRGSVKISVTPYTTVSLHQPPSLKGSLSHTLSQKAIYKGEFVKNPYAQRLHESLMDKENAERTTPGGGRRLLRSGGSAGGISFTGRMAAAANKDRQKLVGEIMMQKYQSAYDMPMPSLFQ